MIEKQQVIIGYFRSGKSQRQLSRELGLSRNTVKKYIAEYRSKHSTSGELDSDIINTKGVLDPPIYDSSNRVARSLTSEIIQQIDAYLSSNEAKKKQGLHKQCMKGTDIHAALLEAGHRVGYTTVCRYIRTYRERHAEVYIRQRYVPGQSVEFDWGYVKIHIKGQLKNLMLAVFTSAYSNYRWAFLYYRQDMSSFLDSHVKYFSQTGHVPSEVVYDNMRVAVKRYTVKNADKIPTDDLLKLSTYYCFAYRFCNARRGNEKGHVERSVEYVRRKAFALRDSFDTLEEANQYLDSVCERLNRACAKGKTDSIQSHFDEEIKVMPAAPPAYDIGELRTQRVDKYSCVKVDANYYSVEEGHVGSMVDVKIYPLYLRVYNAKNELIAVHKRAHSRFEYYLNIEHYLKTLRNKPGALSGSLTLYQAEQSLKDIFLEYFSDRSKDFIDLLLYLREHGYSITEVKNAIEQCISLCPHQLPQPDKIKILLRHKSTSTQQIQTQKITTDSQMSADIKHHAQRQLQNIQSLIS